MVMTEYEETVRLAGRILNRPNADPDDDLAMLSRQFLRQVETVTHLMTNLPTWTLRRLLLLIESELKARSEVAGESGCKRPEQEDSA